MSGLLFLTADDFGIPESKRDSKGNIMCHGIRGISLIVFYSPLCHHCKTLIPIFKKLPGTIPGCQFGMINISANKRCIEMSKGTIAPIKSVPYIVLYVHGRPYMVYGGPYDRNEICSFVIEVSNSIQKQQFHKKSKQNARSGNKKRSSGFTTGIPIFGDGNDDVSYLDFVVAYPPKR